MKARLTLLAIGVAMAFLGCASQSGSDAQLQHPRIAQYTENGVLTVNPDQVFEN
jgi:hypothetical protein